VEQPEVRATVRRLLRNIPSGATAPAFGWPTWARARGRAIDVDDEGNLWVVNHFLPGEELNRRTVIAADGTWLGNVDLPPTFAPTHIGGDFVLGTWTDSLDVEHVRLYRLIKR